MRWASGYGDRYDYALFALGSVDIVPFALSPSKGRARSRWFDKLATNGYKTGYQQSHHSTKTRTFCLPS